MLKQTEDDEVIATIFPDRNKNDLSTDLYQRKPVRPDCFTAETPHGLTPPPPA